MRKDCYILLLWLREVSRKHIITIYQKSLWSCTRTRVALHSQRAFMDNIRLCSSLPREFLFPHRVITLLWKPFTVFVIAKAQTSEQRILHRVPTRPSVAEHRRVAVQKTINFAIGLATGKIGVAAAVNKCVLISVNDHDVPNSCTKKL